jgi:hypothetical protein
MVFNATFKNISVISWWCVLLVEEQHAHSRNAVHVSRRIKLMHVTKLSMARLAKLSLSPPCLWHIKL